MKRNLALLAMVFLAPSMALGENWCHEYNKSSDSSLLQMDYQIAAYSDRFAEKNVFRKNMWIHLSNPTFSGQEKVRFVLLTYFVSRYSNSVTRSPETGKEIDAQWDSSGHRFSANYNDPYVYAGYSNVKSSAGTFYQEIAVVVDGKWLSRADGYGNNFAFDANKYQDFCANPF